jgi:hypothetical protein
MAWKTLVALLLLAAALGGFYAYDTYWLEPARQKTELAKGRLWDIEPAAVSGVTIARREDTVRLARADDRWEVVEPVQSRGEGRVIEELVRNLTLVRVDREIAADPAKLGEFGLDPPVARVTLEVTGRAAPLTLEVGSTSPTGAWVYGRADGKPAVLALSEIVARDVARPPADFRDKTVLGFSRRDVTALDLEVEGSAIALEAGEDGEWRIVKPRPYPADKELIAAFLDALASARVKEFAAEAPTALGPYGLDRAASVTVWVGKDKDRAAKTLKLGRVDRDKGGVYVMRAGEPGVMLAGEGLWRAVPKTVAALRSKVVVSYASDKLRRVEIEHDRGQVTLEKEGTAPWRITAPTPLKADAGAVSRFLWAVRGLRALAFLAEEAQAIPRFLARPAVTVRLWEEERAEPRTLLLAPSTEERGGQPTAVAAVAGQGPVVLVDAKALTTLALTPTDLRDRSVVPAFENKDVARARLAAAGTLVVAERSGESDWRIVEPTRGPAKAVAVMSLFLNLRTLRWKEIAAEAPEDPARFGLDRPELEIVLAKADGAELAKLQVGRREGTLTYVRSGAGPAVYAVESAILEDLRKAPAEIAR